MFITFEGGEGSGKTTVIKAVSEFLTENNIDNIITREPGGSRISEDIRKIILDSKNQSISAETESLLFAAARTQHLKETILPALREKKFVLCDRYLDSSLAYQGYARGLGIQEVLKINCFATKHMPDYTIYIDTDPKEGLRRVFNRSETNRLDKEGLIFHKKVREGFLRLSKKYPYRYIVIDGNCSLDQLIFRVIEEIKRVISEDDKMKKYTLFELKEELKKLNIAINNLSASSAKYGLVSQAIREIEEEIRKRETR